MDRAPRGLEGAMVRMGDQVGPTLIAGCIAGHLPTERLRDAVAAIAARRAVLRTALRGGRLVVLPPDPARIPLHVCLPARTGEPGAARRGAIEAELRRPLDLGRGMALRVVQIPEPGGSTVILAAHPALVDDVSLGRLLDEILSAAAAAMEDRPFALQPEIARSEALDEVPAPMRWAAPVLRRMWARDVVEHQQDPILPPEGPGPLRAMCAFRRGTPHGLRRLRVAAHRNSVGIGAVALGALAFALARHRAQQGPTGRLRIPLDLGADLRRAPSRPIPEAAVGLYTGSLRLVTDLDGSTTFWGLVRSLGRRARTLAGWRLHLLPDLVADGCDPRDLLDAAGADPLAPGAPPGLLNPGRWAHTIDHGPFVLRDVYGAGGVIPRGSPLSIRLRGMPDGLCLSAVGAAPALSGDTLDGLLDEVFDALEHPPADGATLHSTQPLRALVV